MKMSGSYLYQEFVHAEITSPRQTTGEQAAFSAEESRWWIVPQRLMQKEEE
jgi:hypothetical protein